MRNREVSSRKQQLDHVFRQTKNVSQDPEILSHWARYLCVLVSGFLESSIRIVYGQYAREKASPNVANFVEAELKYFQNAKMERILELARLFSPAWEAELRVATEGEPKDAVNSIVANKNSIAHGEPVGITVARMTRYYESSLKVLETIETQCAR